MANVFNVARYISQKIGRTSSWKLQKLCYYAQAWSIAWTDQPLFLNRIEAWRNGPVCPELYDACQKHFYIHLTDIPKHLEDAERPLTDDETNTIDRVLEHYACMKPYELRAISTDEPPWKQARKGIAENIQRGEEITPESMGAYFRNL